MQILLLAFMELFGFLLAGRASSAAARAPAWATILVAVMSVLAALILAAAATFLVAALIGAGVGVTKST